MFVVTQVTTVRNVDYPRFAKPIFNNKSKKGNYISITCDVYVTSQNALDKIYIDLSKNKNILFVL